jgi:hypothetical protein
MICRLEDTGEATFRFCSDGAAVGARSIVRAQVIDEITQAAPITDIAVKSLRPHLAPRVASDGLVGLVGTPSQVFSVPNVAIDVDFEVRAEGYVAWRSSLTVDPNSLPHQPTVELHRSGTRIVGRLVQLGVLGATPLPAATVTLDGVWPTFPAPGAAIPADPPFVVSLTPALYAPRDAAAATLARCAMTLALPQAKQLMRPTEAGSTRIVLSNQEGLLGNIVAIEPDHPDRAEYVSFASIDGFSTVDQPATLWLDHPLAHPHREGVDVVPASPQVTGALNPLSRSAMAGDVCAFLGAMADLAGAAVVQLSGGPAPEYHAVHLFETTTDVAGYYRLPLLSRVAQVRVQVAHPSITTLQRIVAPRYESAEFRFDIVST